MDRVAFAARHKWDSRFWLIFLITSWIAIAMGFGHPIRLRFTGQADYEAPAILVLHVWSYFGWMTLLSVQATLVGRDRIALHRKLGIAGMFLAIAVTASGLFAEVFSQRFYAAQDPENIRFFMVPLYATIVFGLFALLAFLKRRDPASHKRLIFLATAAAVNAGYSRWWGRWLGEQFGDGFWGIWIHYYTGMELMLAAAVIYDLVTRGTVHKVLRWGAPLAIALQLAGSYTWHSDWWPPLGRELLNLAPGAPG
ncbi:MAG: hypothetical protein RL339_184 [Pseudomonadota bacterium]|jgi:hypothetical protein